MFKIIEKDWYKRRSPSGEDISPVHVAIPDYQEIHNHICNMVVSYSDGSTKALIARVLFNEFNNQWIVDGMEVVVKVFKEAQENYQSDEQTG
ncbi:hypothetical protein [Thalassotalea profundi]|uniref:Uncharacterized protein n=1 Tax=Thalassotalea profundi TaxID=2036687 RepID=A0ABQ3J7V6_9GAMM|nr:hypothetical protein [Thalassotalea profundi]GHF01976.1 hypothetical protein GCM10011501_34230 [Thalassotalea profundi]